MTTVTMSSRTFKKDASGGVKAANHGPVFFTDRGRPMHALLENRVRS
jgi:hypothetical protein